MFSFSLYAEDDSRWWHSGQEIDQEVEASWERIQPFTHDRQLFSYARMRYSAVAGRIIRFELREGARMILWKDCKDKPKWIFQGALNTAYRENFDPVTAQYHAEGQFEVEFNPTWVFSPKYRIVQRNRYELARREYDSTWRSTLRNRSRLVREIEGMGALKEAHIAYELFYNFNLHRIDQLRLTPIEFVWETACKQRVLFALTWRHFFVPDSHPNRLLWTVDWVY